MGHQLAGLHIDDGDLVLVLDIDKGLALAVQGRAFQGPRHGDGRHLGGGLGVDQGDAAAGIVQHPDQVLGGLQEGAVGLGAGLDGGAHLAGHGVGDQGRPGGGGGDHDLIAAIHRHGDVGALGVHQLRGHLAGVHVDGHHPVGAADIEPAVGGVEGEIVPAAVRPGDLAAHRQAGRRGGAGRPSGQQARGEGEREGGERAHTKTPRNNGGRFIGPGTMGRRRPTGRRTRD